MLFERDDRPVWGGVGISSACGVRQVRVHQLYLHQLGCQQLTFSAMIRRVCEEHVILAAASSDLQMMCRACCLCRNRCTGGTQNNGFQPEDLVKIVLAGDPM